MGSVWLIQLKWNLPVYWDKQIFEFGGKIAARQNHLLHNQVEEL